MKRNTSTVAWQIAAAFLLVLLPTLVEAASDSASFESFYRQSWSVSPWTWALAAVAAIAAAAAVFLFAPAAGPVVGAIGTWIGGMFGFSGIAATNFGLALLGGGSIAAGGFGIAGGTAVLAAAFSFTTDIAIDYGSGKAVEKYRYQRFVNASEQMTTLPLPRNDDGPPAYEAAMAILANVKESEPLSSPKNRALVQAAIIGMSSARIDDLSADEEARNETLIALLCFVADEYKVAKSHAQLAYGLAERAEITRTLPAFLLATSLLYDEQVDFKRASELFRYSIRQEPDSPLTPLLFAVFLDRMNYRLNDGSLSTDQLSAITEVAEFSALADRQPPIQVILLSRHIIRLKLEQQKISSLAVSSNKAVRESDRTLSVVKTSLRDYEKLLEGAQFLAGALSTSGALAEEGVPEELKDVRSLLTAYSKDRARLQKLVAELGQYQAGLSVRRVATSKPPIGGSEHLALLLKEAELNYSIDEEELFRLEYAVDEERSQVVWISPKTEKAGALELRYIWSVAYEADELPSPDILKKLLEANSNSYVGAWQANKLDDGYAITFAAPLAANADSSQLAEVLGQVMIYADEMEKELTQKDEY